MGRLEITKEIVKRYNNGEGTIKDIVKEYEPKTNRDKFNRDLKKYGIVRDKDLDKYIIPIDNIEGQIDILEGTVEPKTIAEDKAIENTKKEVIKPIKASRTVIEKVVDPIERKKKTFEIDLDLDQLIRVQAAILDITINDYVNKVLRESIPDTTKSIIK